MGQYEDFPALYLFRADHTGVRTTYPTGSLSFGTPYGFSWKAAGDIVTLVTAHAVSGQMPGILASVLCG